MMQSGMARSSSSPALSDTGGSRMSGQLLAASGSDLGHSRRAPRPDPPWRTHDAKAQKKGYRGAISTVGKSIMGEDGVLQRAKGATYRGEWDDNKKSGYGVQVYPNGDKYEGQWLEGVRHGEGALWKPAGRAAKLRKVYVGGWADDKRHGRGTCFFKNGEFFQGEWSQGRMQGVGTFRYESGDQYVGGFHEGKRSGVGTLTKANGDCYEGQWLAGVREGTGSFFYAESGKVLVGEWVNDLPKAGVYTQASQNPEQAVDVACPWLLPPVRLALPTEILQGAIAGVRRARRAVRLQAAPVAGLFSEEELVALRAAFAQVVGGPEGRAGRFELEALCAQLGAPGLSSERLGELLRGAGAPCEAEEDVAVNIEQFLRLVAVLLEDEAGEQSASPLGGGGSSMLRAGSSGYL